MKPIWKKVKEIEPGLYWYGGWSEVPLPSKRTEVVASRTELNTEYWYARIGDLPPDPVMPQPELKEDDPVMVRDYEDSNWLRRHFAGWSIRGDIKTWRSGTKWASDGGTVAWKYWKLPTAEDLQ